MEKASHEHPRRHQSMDWQLPSLPREGRSLLGELPWLLSCSGRHELTLPNRPQVPGCQHHLPRLIQRCRRSLVELWIMVHSNFRPKRTHQYLIHEGPRWTNNCWWNRDHGQRNATRLLRYWPLQRHSYSTELDWRLDQREVRSCHHCRIMQHLPVKKQPNFTTTFRRRTRCLIRRRSLLNG